MKRKKQIIKLLDQIVDCRYLEYLYILITELAQAGRTGEQKNCCQWQEKDTREAGTRGASAGHIKTRPDRQAAGAHD